MTEYYNPGTDFNGRSSRFGRRTHPITGATTGHAGDDWRAPADTNIPAAANGKVVLKRYNYNGRTGYGHYLVLEHFDNNTNQIVHTLYAHMIRESTLIIGTIVNQRDTIGNVGNTGGSTGNHLHFEVRTGGTAGNPLSGTPVDPDTYDISGLVAPNGASPQTNSAKAPLIGNKAGFKFPVAPAEGKEYTAEEIYGKLSQEDTGYYLLSANGFWHGGVHFTNKNFSAEMPVQAITEGTVIAYRINRNYPETPTSPYYKSCKYSTGFCLIKHTVPFTREKTAEKKQQEAQQQAAQKLADTKAQLTGKQIVVQNTTRNYRDEEGITAKKLGQYPIGAVLEVNTINDTPKENYYFAKVKQTGIMDDKGNITHKKENLIDGEHYIALLNKSGDIDKTSAGKPAYKLLPEQTTAPAIGAKTATYTAPIPASSTNTTPTTTETKTDQTTAPATNTTDTTASGEKAIPPLPMSINLEFYSLYMHLSAYEDYLPPKEETNKEASKEPEKPKQITVKAEGLRIRDKHRAVTGSKVIGKISNGAKLEIIETKESGQYTDVNAKLLEGTVTGSTVKKGDTLWVPIKDGNKTYYTEETKQNAPKEKKRPSYWEGKVTAIVKNANGLTIWEKFEGGVLKTKLGDINQGSQFTFNSTEVRTIIHEMRETLIAECTPIGTFKFRSNGEQPKGTFWTKVDKNSITRTKVEPLVFDTVVPCNTKIIAGEPLGYLGIYETPSKDGDTKTKKQIHVEIFTPNLATVEFLLNNPFKLTGRKYIKIPKGTVLKGEVPISSDIDVKKILTEKIDFPGISSDPKQQDYGFGKGTNLANTTAAQTTKSTTVPTKTTATTTHTATPATTTQTSTEPKQEPLPDYTTIQDHYFAVDKLTVVKNQRIVETGTGKDKKIEVVAGKDDYYEIGVEKHTGYLKKEDMKGKEIDQHEWAKLGFQLVQEANPKSDGYLEPKLMPAVFQQIYSKIDTDKDGKLQPEELKTALQNEEIRDQWSKLIAYHPSEWQLDTRSILARFTQLLTNPLAPPEKALQAQALLAHETQKMNTLTFLEQVVPPISPTPMLYHFHPVAFVEFMDKKQKQKINKNISKEEFVRTVFEAAKIEESQSGVPAAITTAQAILETGYGKSVPEDIDTGKYSYNLFGIKAHGNPSYVTVWTHEVVNGNRIKIKDKFMAYNSFEESIKGRTDFFNKNKRYHFLFNSKDPDYWADGLQSSGYATDPNYAKVLKQIMTQWKLR